MPAHFPLTASRTGTAPNEVVGVFDAHGYWFSIPSVFETIRLAFPVEELELAQQVAGALNAVYELGHNDARIAIQEALGLRPEY